ncbi:MAG: HNH endonuclease family protein, partial [Pseudomonadota bacterium]
LFGHIRTIYAKQKQRATLVKEFQEHVTEYKAPIDLVDNVIKPYAEVWDFVRDADFEATEHAETINEHLSWLNRVDFKDWVPPALVYFKRFRQKPKLLADFFGSLERLTYFLLVTKVGINERIDTYAALNKEIEPAAFDGDLAGLNTLALTDKQQLEFVAALDGDIYRNLPKARMALVLRLESLVRAPGVQLQDAVSLEHVLPQTPPDGSDWIKWFPDEDERDSWTHRLANLVPLDRNKNSSASNYDFVKKKDAYFRGKGKASPFVLTQEVRSENEWTPTLLAERQQRLVGVLKEHWNLVVVTGNATGAAAN